MSQQIKRYRCFDANDMREMTDGEWVKFQDADAEREHLKLALKMIRQRGWATESADTRKNLADIANEALIRGRHDSTI